MSYLHLFAKVFTLVLFIASACIWRIPVTLAQSLAAPPERWARPQLVIPYAVETPVQLEHVSLRTEISGNLAITEVSMTFHNPNRRVLEGDLQFPLLDGQQVQSFAMDVNGRLRDAVPVDKARGQAVFEDITRGQVDPGLLQLTQGNNFRLRVYPIPALGVKQVVVRYSETLHSRNGRLIHWIPLDYAVTLASFKLELSVTGALAPPLATSGQLEELAFKRMGGGFHAQVSRERFAGRGVLEFEIAPTPGARAYTQVFDAKTYFYAELPVPTREVARELPKIVGLVWDSSGSAAARDHVREFALLDAYFRRLRNGEVRLTRLRDSAEAVQSFRITNGEWRELRAALQATPYDGATNLGVFQAEAAVREYLLFSDGLSNFGELPFPALAVAVYTVSATHRSDPALLRHIAEAAGGRYIDLIAETRAESARKLLFASTRVTALTSDGATQLVLRSPYPEHERIAVAGQLTERATRLRFTVTHPGARSFTLELPVRVGESPFPLAAPLWARLKIATLETQYDVNRAEIRRLGREFRLVTRETSLIILDRVEDYVRYEIAPPEELLAEYERLRQTAMQQRGADRSTHLANVVRRFDDKIAWWNRDFPQGAKAASQPALVPMESAGGMRRERDDAPRDQAPPTAARRAAPAARLMQREGGASNFAAKAVDAVSEQRVQTLATIQLKRWEPDAPYATRMRNAAREDIYRVYLDERPGYLNSTAFYLDTADILFDKQQPTLALRVLSNLAEMDLESRHILRVLGYRLLQAKQAKLVIPVLRKVLDLSPEEPQSYRDLGLALAADRQYQQAIDTLYEVVIRPWHGRFPDIEIITLAELNAIVATCGKNLDLSRIDARLVKNLPLDLRVVLTWDADNSDIDLWVTDANGEKAYYGHQLTYQGGRMSLDFTGGYGPEEFSLKRAKPGKYKVEAQYYGDRRQTVAGPATLQVKLSTKFGLPSQQEQIVTLRLKDRSESVFVGEFEVKEDASPAGAKLSRQ